MSTPRVGRLGQARPSGQDVGRAANAGSGSPWGLALGSAEATAAVKARGLGLGEGPVIWPGAGWTGRTASGPGAEPEHLELGGVGFAGPDNQGDAAIPGERKEGRPREEALAQGLGEERGGRLSSANGDVRFVPPPPTCSLLFPSPFSTGGRPQTHGPYTGWQLLVEKVREESTEFL